jgi:thioredoxin-like negative regulator of GroEL
MSKTLISLNDGNFTEVAVRQDGKPVLLDFWSPGCPPCRAMATVLTALAVELDGRAVVATVNVDAECKLADAMRIRVVPTVVLLHDGQVKDVFVGVTPKAILRIGILRFLAAAMTGRASCRRRYRRSRAAG